MKKVNYNLENHPRLVGRKSDLDPNQPGLFRKTKQYLINKEKGEQFEKKILQKLKEQYPNNKIFGDVYFETGNYITSLCLYQSYQIDGILIFEHGVICIEMKCYEDSCYSSLVGGVKSKSWKLIKKNNSKKIVTNGVKQNYVHKKFIEELFKQNKIDCPVYSVTVIGGISGEKIHAHQTMYDHLEHENNLIARINYIKDITKDNTRIDVKEVEGIINEFRNNDDAAEIQHIVYVKHAKDQKLPKKCKKITRNYSCSITSDTKKMQ